MEGVGDMTTVTIQTGNSDNKLTQQEWASFVKLLKETISLHAKIIHFFGGSSTWESWQNVAWVIEVHESDLEPLKTVVTELREHFRQDSVAWTEGITKMV